MKQKTDVKPIPLHTINARELFDALVGFGILQEGERSRRVVIDLEVGNVPKVYVERYMDSRVLQILQTLKGTQIDFVDSST